MTNLNGTRNTLHLHVHLVSITVLDQERDHKTQKVKKIKHSLRTNGKAVTISIPTNYKYGIATLKSFEKQTGVGRYQLGTHLSIWSLSPFLTMVFPAKK